MTKCVFQMEEKMSFDDFDVQSDVIKTGNGDCEYVILPNNLCGCNPAKYGGYERCDKEKCPLKSAE